MQGKDFDEQVGDTAEAGLFVPLADVPDEIWKKVPLEIGEKWGREGGRDTHGGRRSDGPEHPNHYADIDAPFANGQNWRQRCLAEPANIDVTAWQELFAEMAERGALNTLDRTLGRGDGPSVNDLARGTGASSMRCAPRHTKPVVGPARSACELHRSA